MGQRQQRSGGEPAPESAAPDGLDGDPVAVTEEAQREHESANDAPRAAAGRRPFTLSFTAWLVLNQLGQV